MDAMTRANVRAIVWLGAGGIGYGVIENIISPRLEGLVSAAGGWAALGVSPTMFIKVEIAGLLVLIAALCGVGAIVAAGLVHRGRADLVALPIRLAFVGAWLFVASGPLETWFLFERGNHVPGSPSGAVMALTTGGLLLCQWLALWGVWRARRAASRP